MARKRPLVATTAFEVDAVWLRACGHPASPNVFPVVDAWQTQAYDDFFATFVKLELPNGRTWIVARGRGWFVEEC